MGDCIIPPLPCTHLLRLTNRTFLRSISRDDLRTRRRNAAKEELREFENIYASIYSRMLRHPGSPVSQYPPCYRCHQILPIEAFGDAQRRKK